MTKATNELSIAQPSLSKMIRRLEKELWMPLFDRQGGALDSASPDPAHMLLYFGITWHQQHYLSQAARTFRQFVMEYPARLE